jgi:hypothetical protein
VADLAPPPGASDLLEKLPASRSGRGRVRRRAAGCRCWSSTEGFGWFLEKNQGGGELLSEEGKKEKEKEGLGVIWGAPMTRRWPRWCSVPESREKRGWELGMAPEGVEGRKCWRERGGVEAWAGFN